MRPTTPLRQMDSSSAVTGAQPTDDTELLDRLTDVLESTTDHSSWSDQLASFVQSPAEALHLSPQRANVLRGLGLPTGGTVLEIGAGSGAVTRYLGENSILVDALEVEPGLAALASRRCGDLPGVQVHQLELADVPLGAEYDTIVAMSLRAGTDVGGLLRRCRALLRTGGLIVVAADARDGSPGAPADALHVTRRELELALGEARLDGHIVGAFPHHRLTTTLIDHAPLRRLAAPLLLDLVRPPSQDSSDPSGPGLSFEWAQHVADDDDAEHPGSFVLVAGDHVPEPDPAVFWSTGRRAEVSACNRVQPSARGCVIVRARAFPSAPEPRGPLSLVPHTEPYVPGRSLTEVLSAARSLADVSSHLRAWRELLAEAEGPDGTVPWDLIPRNVQVTAEGSLRPIDQEWARDGASVSMVLSRGTFWLSHDLRRGSGTPWWLTGHTITSGADVLTALAGAPVVVDWRSAMIDSEAESMGWVNPMRPLDSLATRIRKEWQNVSQLGREPHDPEIIPPEDDSTATAAALQSALTAVSAANSQLRQRVEELELARREEELANRDHAIGLRATIESLRDETARAKAVADRERRKARAAHEELTTVRDSTTWRLGRVLVAPVAGMRKRAGR